MTVPKSRPNDEVEIAGRLLALLGFVVLFSFFGFLVMGLFLPVIVDAERPTWEQALRARTAEVTGLVLGAVFGAGLHFFYFRRRVGRK